MALTTKHRSEHVPCDLCQKPATYDAPLKSPVGGGRWANLCPTCYTRHAVQGEGTHFAISPPSEHGLSWEDWSGQMEKHFTKIDKTKFGVHPADMADYNDYFHMHPKEAAQAIHDQMMMEGDPTVIPDWF